MEKRLAERRIVITQPTYIAALGVVAPLAQSPEAIWEAVAAGESGVQKRDDLSLASTSVWAAKLNEEQWVDINGISPVGLLPFEKLAFAAARQALDNLKTPIDLATTLFILSTTKGAIEHLNQLPNERLLLHESAKMISTALGLKTKPVVVSHACISGVVALLHAQRYLNAGLYEKVIVVGADRLSRFVVSGFQSFQAIADQRCKPFDKDRRGINLGEAAAAIILSSQDDGRTIAKLLAGATSNDANHISGPSRTGEELGMAINRTLKLSGVTAGDVGMISAHGTATPYNDEMEAKAFAYSGLLNNPVFSSKANTGHTLGAAGILESILCIESLRRQKTLPSMGYEVLGVSTEILVSKSSESAKLNYVLKTASGFGGCNAAALFS